MQNDEQARLLKIRGKGFVFDWLAKLRSARIAVLGDLMLDESIYVTIRNQPGLHKRDNRRWFTPIYDSEVGSDGRAREYRIAGGVAAAARCLKNFAADPIVVGLIGNDKAGKDFLSSLSDREIEHRTVVDDSRPTTTKTRYYAISERLSNSNDYGEIFRYDRESIIPIRDTITTALCELIAGLGKVDAVILGDFGKGAVNRQIAESAMRLAS